MSRTKGGRRKDEGRHNKICRMGALQALSLYSPPNHLLYQCVHDIIQGSSSEVGVGVRRRKDFCKCGAEVTGHCADWLVYCMWHNQVNTHSILAAAFWNIVKMETSVQHRKDSYRWCFKYPFKNNLEATMHIRRQDRRWGLF